MKAEEIDPKGLMREAFAMAGIDTAECRSIFMDWALSLPAGVAPQAAMQALLAAYSDGDGARHPMAAVLREGLAPPPVPQRRGGRTARRRRGAV